MDDETKKVLIIDDDETVCLTLKELLNSYNYNVDVCHDAEIAIKNVNEVSYDIVLCDIEMPNKSGIWFLKNVLKEHKDIIVIMMTGYATVELATKSMKIGAYDFITKPTSIQTIVKSINQSLEKHKLIDERKRFEEKLILEVDTATYDLRIALENLKNSQEEIIRRLASAAETRDIETGEHLNRMSFFCFVMACEIGLSKEEQRDIKLASIMHDIGKIGIPDSILCKPGKLTVDERRVMETHTTLGEKILEGSNIPVINLAKEIAKSHHERWDGKGYPEGISKDRIFLPARIAAIADVYDALISRRPYKEAINPRESFDILREGSGTQFDPEILRAFLKNEERLIDVISSNNFREDFCKIFGEVE